MKKIVMLLVSMLTVSTIFAQNDFVFAFEDDSDLANWNHHDEGNVWTAEEFDATGGVDGSGAYKFSDGGYDMVVKRPITATAGTNYTLSIDIKTENWDNETYQITLSVQGLSSTEPSVSINGSTVFTTFTLTGNADAGTGGYIRIGGGNTALANTVWIDNLSYTEASEPTGTQVTFALDMSNEDVSADGVHIAGGMQGWDPAASELTDEDADGVYEITFDMTAGDTVQYTFLNGNGWGGQEDNTGLSDCGVDNGWGAYNRLYVVGEEDETVGPVCFSSCITCDQVYVTFQVDMQNEDVSADGIHIAGSMQGWDPAASEMTDADADGVYEATFALTTGETAYYKYVNGNAWGSEEIVPSDCQDGGNRFYTVGDLDEVLPVVCFSGCSTCEEPNFVEATVTFQADMTNFVGFDPEVHTLEVRGSFNGWGGGDALQADLVDPNLYVLDVTFTENVGNEVFWKFKANPDEDWNNTGWETGDNKVFDWTGEAIVLDAIQPDILPAGAPLENDVTFTFAVQWVDGVINVNSGEPFVQKPDTLVFNGSFLNGWYTWGDCMGEGCETPASSEMPHLSDGDGDNIFTGSFTLPAGHDNLFMAKFGGWYPGIENDAPGTNGAVDNEAGFGCDRVVLIPVDATEFAYETIFGINNPDNELSVVNPEMIPDEFALKGNYPNPFNPETSIMFDLDITSNVTVKIYSLLGEEVITLYNGQADPGVYSIKWNAINSMGRQVPSGVYLYSVTSDKRMQTGKMLLLK